MPTTYCNHVAMHQARDAAAAIAAHGLSTYELMTLIAVATHFGEDDTAYPSYATIAEECACNRDRAITSIQRLIDHGFLEAEHRNRRPSIYKLASWKPEPTSCTKCASGQQPLVANNYQPSATSGQQRPVANSHQTSGQQPPPLVAIDDQLVANSHQTSGQQPPEVEVKESVNGSSARSSSGDRSRGEAQVSVPVEQETATDTAVTPERVLANHFWDKIGKPAQMKSKGPAWRAALSSALARHSEADLRGAIDWTFGVDTFWLKLVMRSDDPLDYFLSKLDGKLKRDYLAWKMSEQNAAKAAAQPATSQPINTPSLIPQWFKDKMKESTL